MGAASELAHLIKVWWLHTLDEDSVRRWVPPYCTIWLTWALLALVVFPPVPTIYNSTGPVAYWLWVGVAVPANAFPMIGLWMRHGGTAVAAINERLLFRDWMGLILQASGHAACHVLLVMFQVAAWMSVFEYDGPQRYAGLTIFTASMLLAWTGGTLILCGQCLRKLQKGMQLERAAAVAAR